MTLSELFHTTVVLDYDTVGENVNYKFIEKGSTLFIYFQGSHETIDWVRNFFFIPSRHKPYKDMDLTYKVHGGFLKAWKEVEDLVILKIHEREGDHYKFNRIIVSGYSHGGALAALCHECVWFHRPDIRDNCWSFGFEAPRIYAGYKVKDGLRERWSHFLMFRNHKDIVTHCPPRIFGFCDVGTVVHMGRFQNYEDFKVKPNWECIKSHYPQLVEASLKEIEFDID